MHETFLDRFDAETARRRRAYARDDRRRAIILASISGALILAGALGLPFTTAAAPILGLGLGLLVPAYASLMFARKWDRLAETPGVTS